MADLLSTSQFAARIKAKHPEYSSVPDATLVDAMLKKYPQYKSMVSIDYDSAFANQKKESSRPSVLSDPKGWWNSHNDDEKQAILDSMGEIAGGTAGAAAGGPTPLAIPGAGAGAVLGKSLAGLAGKAAGIKAKPKTALEEAKDLTLTGVTNAAGEGVGRYVIPPAYRAAKTAVVNAGKRAMVSDTAPEIARLAAEQGVPLTPDMVSAPLAHAESLGERLPWSRSVLRQGKAQQQSAWERNIRRIGETFHPTPVSDEQVGAALGNGLDSNRAVAKDYFDPRYEGINKVIGDDPVAVEPMKQAGSELLAEIPEDAYRFFPSGAMAKIRAAAGLANKNSEFLQKADSVSQNFARKAYKDLDPTEKQGVDNLLAQFGIQPAEAPTMTFSEAQKLRTQLLEAERQLSRNAPSVERSSIPKLRRSLDASIEQSIGTSPDPTKQEALQAWRDLNSQYRTVRIKTDGPKRPGGQGNPVAAKIDRANNPDTLAASVTGDATPFKQAQEAVDPASIDAITGQATDRPNPIRQVQRNYVDRLGRSAQVDDPLLDQRVIAPRTLGRKMAQEEALPTVLGPEATQQLNEAVTTGRAMRPRDLNPSGTGPANETLRMVRKGAGVAGGLGLAGAVGAGVYTEHDKSPSEIAWDATRAGLGLGATALGLRYGARALMNPENASRLMTQNPIRYQPGGIVPGAVTRMAMPNPNNPPPPRSLEEDEDEQNAPYRQ